MDNNNLQIDGPIDEVNSPYPIDKKFEAFNFHVININGNDFDEIAAAFKEARETKGQPQRFPDQENHLTYPRPECASYLDVPADMSLPYAAL